MPRRKRIRARVLIGLVVVLAALMIAGYRRITDPVRLRLEVLAALRSIPVEGLDVGQVTFTPWDGLRITDLVLDSPNRQADRGWYVPPPLHVSRARITCDLLEALMGRVKPTGIDIGEATIAIVCDAGEDRKQPLPESFDVGARHLWQMLTKCQNRLPPVRIAQADLQLMVVEHGRSRLIERHLLHAVGKPTDSGYSVRVDRLPVFGQPMAEAEWSASTRELEVKLDWVRLDTLEHVFPVRVAGLLAGWRLDGRARLDRLVFSAASLTPARGPEVRVAAVDVRLADLSGVVPIEEESEAQSADRGAAARRSDFLQMTGLGGTMSFRCNDPNASGLVEVSANGRLNSAPLTFSLAAQLSSLASLYAPREDAASGSPKTLAGAARSDSGAGFGLEDVLHADVCVEGIELPTARSQAAFLRSARLPGAVRAAFVHYQPQGKINLRMQILPRESSGGDEATRLAGELEALGTSCRYYLFPYDFQEASGRVRFSNGQVLLDGLCARHGSARVRADGVVNNSQEWTGLELVFWATNVPLDSALYEALPDEQRRLWQSAAPLGLCDIETTIQRPDGTADTGALPSDVRVDAHLLAGSLTLEDGRRLTDADGWLTVHHGVVEVHDLQGLDRDAAVRLNGTVAMRDGESDSDLRVAVANLPLAAAWAPPTTRPAEAEIMAAQGRGHATGGMSFAGRAEAWGRIQGSIGAGTRRQHFGVHVTDGELRGLDPSRIWNDCKGWVIVRDGQQQILSFACRQGESWFDAAGMMPAGGTPLTLDLHARAQAMEELVPQFVPGSWSQLARTLGLAGAGDVTVLLRPMDGPAGGQTADIQLRADRMRAEPMPLDLHGVSAHVLLEPGRFELRSSEAQWGEQGRIQAQGNGSWQGENVEADFGLAAYGLKFCPELNAALPEPVTRLLDRIALQGEFDAILHRVHLSGGPQHTWQLEGYVPLRDATLRLGLDLSGVNGEISGTCIIRPDNEVELDATVSVEEGRLAERPIADWHGRIERQPGERWVRLDDLRGKVCDGEALGSVWIDPQTSEYELSLTLKDVSFDKLLPRPKAQPEHERRGRLDGTVYLRGRGGDAGSRRGGGDMRLHGASFLQTPVLASVFSIRPHNQRGSNDTVDRADIRFVWDGSEVRLERVEVQSRDLRLVGEGTWNLRDDTVRMTLWGARPEQWPGILMLDNLLESAGKELVQYHVEGTLASPKVTAEPLYKLSETLRKLVKSGGE